MASQTEILFKHHTAFFSQPDSEALELLGRLCNTFVAYFTKSEYKIPKIGFFEKVVRILSHQQDPYIFNALSNSLGIVYKNNGDYEKAIKVCVEATKKSSLWLKTRLNQVFQAREADSGAKNTKKSEKVKNGVFENGGSGADSEMPGEVLRVIKILCATLLTRAHVIGFEQDKLPKKVKILNQAKRLLQKYAPGDKKLLRAVEKELGSSEVPKFKQKKTFTQMAKERTLSKDKDYSDRRRVRKVKGASRRLNKSSPFIKQDSFDNFFNKENSKVLGKSRVDRSRDRSRQSSGHKRERVRAVDSFSRPKTGPKSRNHRIRKIELGASRKRRGGSRRQYSGSVEAEQSILESILVEDKVKKRRKKRYKINGLKASKRARRAGNRHFRSKSSNSGLFDDFEDSSENEPNRRSRHRNQKYYVEKGYPRVRYQPMFMTQDARMGQNTNFMSFGNRQNLGRVPPQQAINNTYQHMNTAPGAQYVNNMGLYGPQIQNFASPQQRPNPLLQGQRIPSSLTSAGSTLNELQMPPQNFNYLHQISLKLQKQILELQAQVTQQKMKSGHNMNNVHNFSGDFRFNNQKMTEKLQKRQKVENQKTPKTDQKDIKEHTEMGENLSETPTSPGFRISTSEISKKLDLIKQEQKESNSIKNEIENKLTQINEKLTRRRHHQPPKSQKNQNHVPTVKGSVNTANSHIDQDESSRGLPATTKQIKIKMSTVDYALSPKNDFRLSMEIPLKPHFNQTNRMNSLCFDHPSTPQSAMTPQNGKQSAEDSIIASLAKSINPGFPGLQSPSFSLEVYDYQAMCYQVYLRECLKQLKGSIKKKVFSAFTLINVKEGETSFFLRVQHRFEASIKGLEMTIAARIFDMQEKRDGEVLSQIKLDEETFWRLFMSLEAGYVLPTRYPVSAFKTIDCFVHFVLRHFIQVNPDSV